MAEASQRSTLPPQGSTPLAREALIDRLEGVLHVSHERAEKLAGAGFQEPNEVRLAPDPRLLELGFTNEEILKLREGEPNSTESPDPLLEKWLADRKRTGSERPRSRGRPKGILAKNAQSEDLLKRWVAGDDSVMENWIKEGGPPPTKGGSPSGHRGAHGEASASSSPPEPPAPDASLSSPAAAAGGVTGPAPSVSGTGSGPLAGEPPAPTSDLSAPSGPPEPPAPPGPDGSASPSTPGGSMLPGATSAPGGAPLPPASTPGASPVRPEPTTGGREGGGRRVPPLRRGGAPAGAGAQAVAPQPSVTETEIRAREETVLKWLTDMLDKAKAENFEPAQLLREAQELTRQLHEERARRRELEEELEHVKKGSVAVIKYVRNREARAREEAIAAKEADILELRRQLESARASGSSIDTQQLLAERDSRIKSLEEEVDKARTTSGTSAGAQHELSARFREEMETKEREFSEKEAELRRKLIKTEEEVQKLKSSQELAERHAQLTKLDAKNLNSELKSKLDAVEARERALVSKETEFKTKIEELLVKADEFEKKRAPIAYKEQELIRWEEEVRIKEQTLKAQMREMEVAKKEGASPEAMQKLQRLEDIQAEITKKEEELRGRETFLNQKLEELERKERDVTDAEIDRAREDLKAEVAQNKVKTGVNRLDDLLLGGVPLGTSILVNAPSHTGKDVMARLMAAEGLKKGVPVLWILSDKAATSLREEMTVVLPSYMEYEKKGLVRYVDLYSMSLGVTTADPLVTMLSTEDRNFLESLAKAVDEISADFRTKAEYYRLVFETVSTVTAYLDDVQSSFRFLQPFVGRRKRDRCVAYYLVDTGMHSENDVQVLEHMMDGSINLKVEQLKTYLSVKGLGEVASRAWIAYTFTKKVFNIGSFSLDHIR